MKIKRKNPLKKKAKKGFRGYPIATVAYYDPDNKRASKVTVGIVVGESEDDMAALERWYSEDGDVRLDRKINEEILAFIESHAPKSVIMTDGIIGCPHEEGIDYPEGEKCPECPFWAHRDRFTNEITH